MRPGGGVPSPGKKYQTLMAANLHPLSRGSVHVTSADPFVQPAIDPAYTSNPLDLALLVKAVRFVRKLAATPPLCDTILHEYSPGPAIQTDEELEKYVKDELHTIWHPVGSAAMLPKADGGVVDPRLIVYGTRNLRIVSHSLLSIRTLPNDAVIYRSMHQFFPLCALFTYSDTITLTSLLGAFLSSCYYSVRIGREGASCVVDRLIHLVNFAVLPSRTGCGYHERILVIPGSYLFSCLMEYGFAVNKILHRCLR